MGETCGKMWKCNMVIYIYMLLIYDLYDLYDDMNVEEIAKQN